MSTVYIIYWSGTGNTAEMAMAIADGAKEVGSEVMIWNVDEVNIKDLRDVKAIALGCPSMGTEQLEETSMEPFMCDLDNEISRKKIALFGSFGWGNGEWMRDWENRITSDGAIVLGDEGIISNNEPSEEIIEKCMKMGKLLASI